MHLTKAASTASWLALRSSETVGYLLINHKVERKTYDVSFREHFFGLFSRLEVSIIDGSGNLNSTDIDLGGGGNDVRLADTAERNLVNAVGTYIMKISKQPYQ